MAAHGFEFKSFKKIKSHYEVLGVGHDATQDEIKKAYRKLALILHPDKRGADTTEEEASNKFQALALAYKVGGAGSFCVIAVRCAWAKARAFITFYGTPH